MVLFMEQRQWGAQIGRGQIFTITPHGQFRNLHYFNDSSGFWPGGLLLGMDGSLYGMTQAGGENQYGTVFKLTPDGTLVTLYSFSGVDGGFEKFELVEGGDGNLYGTTMGGGTTFNEGGGVGTVFKMTPDGTLVWSYSFSGPDGVFPSGPLVEGLDGNFYGTTLYGGINLPSNASGTIYKITPNGVLTSIFSFTNQEGGIFDSNIDGANPSGALVQAKDGMLYGTTVAGGANGAGTIFKITTNGLLTTLYSFGTIMNGDGGCLDGAGSKQLTIGRDGNFYGTASMGGEYDNFGNGGLGTVFRLSIVRPVISIARPPFDGVTIKPEITISGKAKGDIASVFYQINGSEWAEATTGDNWTNWTANVALLVGVNVIRAYAVDTFEDFSQTNTVRYYRHNPVK